MRPRYLPASFLQPIHRSIHGSQLADRPQLCHPSESFLCNWWIDHSINRNWPILRGLTTLPASFCDRSIDQSIHRNCPSTAALQAFFLFFLQPMNCSINRLQPADRPQPCHLSALFLCNQSMDQRIDGNWPMDDGIITLPASFLRLIDWSINRLQLVDYGLATFLFLLFYCPAIHELPLEILLQALRIMRKLQQDFQYGNTLIKPVAMEF